MTDSAPPDDPSSDHSATYDALYLKGIQYFNECDFFEAHEVWEELWAECRGPARKFYQGLIQSAVALHHFGNGNIRGARKVYLTSRSYLIEYSPVFEGLDVDAFLAQLKLCFGAVLESDEEFPKIEIDAELIPEIHLSPAAAAPPSN